MKRPIELRDLCRPSAADRWLKCPGSVALTLKVLAANGITHVDDDGLNLGASEAADEGSFLHMVAAAALDGEHEADEFLGTKSSCDRFEVTQEDVDALQIYLDAVRFTRDDTAGDLTIETKLVCFPNVIGVEGTADAVVVSDDELHVFDLKMGRGVFVDARRNAQLMSYLHGARQKFGAAGKTRGQLKSKNGQPGALVTTPKRTFVHIVQPRYRSGDNGWRTHEVKGDELMRFVLSGGRTLQAIADGTERTSAGEHCRWCPVRDNCATFRKVALKNAQSVFNDETMQPTEAASDLPAVVGGLPDSKLSALASNLDLLRDFIKATEAELERRVRQGNTGLGFKLVAQVGNRAWRDEAAAEKALRDWGVDPMTEPSLVSPAQAEKLLGKKRKAAVAPLTHRPSKGTKVVPDTHPGEAINPAAVFNIEDSNESKQ